MVRFNNYELQLNEVILNTGKSIFMVRVRHDGRLVEQFFYEFTSGALAKMESIYRWLTGKTLGLDVIPDPANPQYVFNNEVCA